jgi:hypothetical protein
VLRRRRCQPTTRGKRTCHGITSEVGSTEPSTATPRGCAHTTASTSPGAIHTGPIATPSTAVTTSPAARATTVETWRRRRRERPRGSSPSGSLVRPLLGWLVESVADDRDVRLRAGWTHTGDRRRFGAHVPMVLALGTRRGGAPRQRANATSNRRRTEVHDLVKAEGDGTARGRGEDRRLACRSFGRPSRSPSSPFRRYPGRWVTPAAGPPRCSRGARFYFPNGPVTLARMPGSNPVGAQPEVGVCEVASFTR